MCKCAGEIVVGGMAQMSLFDLEAHLASAPAAAVGHCLHHGRSAGRRWRPRWQQGHFPRMTSTEATRRATSSPTMIRALRPLNKSAGQRLSSLNVLGQAELNGDWVSVFRERRKCTAVKKWIRFKTHGKTLHNC